MTQDESIQVVLALAKEGIDPLEISGGTYESAAMIGDDQWVGEAVKDRQPES